jgi:hypothetical protein
MSDELTLLEETIDILKTNKRKVTDIKWVGSSDGKFAISWNKFIEIANFKYNNGYGSEEIIKDLVVVGKDFWLERHEYDGSEWWEYKSIPIRTKNAKKFTKVRTEQYESTIEELNKDS